MSSTQNTLGLNSIQQAPPTKLRFQAEKIPGFDKVTLRMQMGSSTYLFGTWTRLVSISFVGIGMLVDLQPGVSVKLQHCAEEKNCFIA